MLLGAYQYTPPSSFSWVVAPPSAHVLDAVEPLTLLYRDKGEAQRIVEANAKYLQSLEPQAANNQLPSFTMAVNRSYFDAAVDFRPQFNIDSIIKSRMTTRISGLESPPPPLHCCSPPTILF